jgi:hypothetical protein
MKKVLLIIFTMVLLCRVSHGQQKWVYGEYRVSHHVHRQPFGIARKKFSSVLSLRLGNGVNLNASTSVDAGHPGGGQAGGGAVYARIPAKIPGTSFKFAWNSDKILSGYEQMLDKTPWGNIDILNILGENGWEVINKSSNNANVLDRFYESTQTDVYFLKKPLLLKKKAAGP